VADASILGPEGVSGPFDWTSRPGAVVDVLDADALANVTPNPHHRMAWAFRAVTCNVVVEKVRQLIGEAVVVVEPVYLMAKHPGSGFAVPAHQDGITEALWLDPGRAVAVWLAVTDATPDNGCLEVVPGSHHQGYREVERGPDMGNGSPLQLADPPGDEEFRPVPLQAGQGVAMDLRLVHRSRPNRTTSPRIGVNICYAAPDALTVHDGPRPALMPLPRRTELL
jgi:ectoine hydroxylase-related dioxygenase (phytanoyl-CoA dioxygenase family)